jgi:hypothetical protein
LHDLKFLLRERWSRQHDRPFAHPKAKERSFLTISLEYLFKVGVRLIQFHQPVGPLANRE